MKQSKRGFTIVELVIVIAVIAVLAAVLIPTFSSLIKKANLSADMQAVREMNLALAADEDLNGRPTDIETVMQILAYAGYNAENWETLTTGYQVYWYAEANRLVLYSSKEADVVYPEEYKGYMTNIRNNKGEVIRHFYLYNQTVKNALEADLTLDSSGGGQSMQQVESSASGSEKVALNNINSAVADNATIKGSLGLTDAASVYVNGSRELTSDTYATGSYASMQVMQISSSSEPTLTSSGEVEANMYYISVHTTAGATAAEITTAQKAASEYVYTLFTQMNSDKVSEDATILMPAGTVLNASAHEWKPVKTFSGYFGTTNAADPVVVQGAKLTKATGYVETLSFDGSSGKYFVTGFFGALYGDSTVENLTYKDTTIDQPGTDFDMTLSSKAHSRNSIGIIGGVIDIPDQKGDNQFKQASNVTVRNVTVENTVTIKGGATAAGLIGYVGGSGDGRAVYNGKLTIDNCHVSATVIGGYEWDDYGPCGGLIGFSCRAEEGSTDKDGDGKKNEQYNIIIKDCTFDGSVKGYRSIGAAVGDIRNGRYFFLGTNDFSNAVLDTSNMLVSTDTTPDGKHPANAEKTLVGLVGYNDKGTIYFSTCDIQNNAIKLADGMAVIGAKTAAGMKRNFNDVTGTTGFDTMTVEKDGVTVNIGANNGIWG